MKLTLAVLAALMLAGCAVGRSLDDDTPMLGVRLGNASPESIAGARKTGGTIGSTIGGLAGGPAGAALGNTIGELAGWGLAMLGIGGTAIAARRATTNGAKAARLEGHSEGWDERQKAGTVQDPLM